MKKALFFALAGLLSATTPALAYHPPAANVNFASERGVPFGLVLDGRPLTRGVARQVHVDQLVPGLHWADFTVPNGRWGAIRFRSQVWLQPGLETSFVLLVRPNRPFELRQVDAVALCGPGHGNGYGGGNGGYPGYDPYDPYDSDDQGSGYPPSGYPSPSGGGYGPNGSNNGGYPPNGGNGAYPPNYPPNGGNGSPAGYYPGSAVSSYRTMPPQDVNALVQAVSQRPFEDSKLSVAKEALAQSSIQADDLKRLLRSFSYETSRVEFAKYAYPHVADRQNFYRVYQAFDFDASTQEVQQAIGSAPN